MHRTPATKASGTWTLALALAVASPSQGREIVVQNLAPFARRQPVAAVVPFAPGIAFANPQLTVENKPTVWQPFGARWPDGSWRQALCLFTVAMRRLEEKRVPLIAGIGTPQDGKVTMPTAQLTFVARCGDEVARVVPQRVEDLENNAMRRVELRRARLGATGIVAEVLVTAWRDQLHADVSIGVFFSDPDSRAMQRKVDLLAVECRGMGLVLRHPGYHGIRQARTDYGSRTVLLQNAVLGDGQGLRRVGVMVPPLTGDRVVDDTLRAVAIAPMLAATSWRGTGAFGPFGVVPEPPPWLGEHNLRVHFATRHRAFVRGEPRLGDPFAHGPHGLERMAGQTGDQGDFGTCKLSGIAWSGLPSMLLEVERSVLQEACRPVHFFEADGSPVDPAEHPEWVVWGGRTHWHAGVSPDRLGKPVPAPPFEDHGWTGKDRQHWSNNYLAAYALLTGAHWARRELQNETRLYLAGQTVDPKLTTSSSGAPRGAGRVALSAAWNLCVDDDPRLRRRMDERVERVYYPQWYGRKLADDRVRPMAVSGPDDRLLQGKHEFWNPWQDALAAVGFAAHHRMTGHDQARVLAEQLATNVVRHGWRVDPGMCEVAMAMRWMQGEPLQAAQWRSEDQTLVQWGTGTLYSEWSIGAVEIARVAAARDGDEAVRAKAEQIQRRMRRARRKPSANYPELGGYDRFGEWDAVRWQ